MQSTGKPGTQVLGCLGRTRLGRTRLVLAACTLLAVAGCRQDMHNQPKFVPQRGTTFYADGRSVRPQVEDTVARNQLRENTYFYTGLINGKEGDGLPFAVSPQVMARGQERYNVYCTPCHSRVGNGAGMIVQRGYAPAGNLHTMRLQAAPLGHFFHVISNGYGAMPDYSAQIVPADRWAIVAYIKALQLSQNATQSDVAPGSHAEPLTSIAEREGFPAEFVKEWTLPPTAVHGTPDGGEFVLPPPSAPTGTGDSTAPRTKPVSANLPAGPTVPKQ